MARIQTDLFEPTIAQRFEAWKQTPGGRQLLNWIYRDAAQYAARFIRTGQRVSMDFLFHRQRDRLRAIQLRLAKSGCTLPKVGGYRLNDHFTAYISRHIVSRRPEWSGACWQSNPSKPESLPLAMVADAISCLWPCRCECGFRSGQNQNPSPVICTFL